MPTADTAPGAPGVSAATLVRVERESGAVATRAISVMDDRLPWFRTLPPDQRSWVTLVAQAGISGYVGWATGASSSARLTEQVFGTAPRDLMRSVSFRRTVELVRVAISVADEQLPMLGSTDAERAALADSLLRYSREIAFAAAGVYAAAAENRGAWDARVEAAIVDGVVRGQHTGELASQAATLNWDATGPTAVIVGAAPPGDPLSAVAAVAEWSRRRRRAAMAGVQGARLVVLLAGEDPEPSIAELFGDGPVVRGPAEPGLRGAVNSAAEALAGLDVATAWPAAPRPVDTAELLVERVVNGDRRAADRLRRLVFAPLDVAGSPLLQTLDAYLDHSGALEPAARALFVHPNTVRYRLHRVAELTGRDPWSARDQLALRIALMLGRLG
ncbi:PucR family transcriptional regulator [Nakamurella lactea]|uniref:PucR family transcriptional regulator n=1 Tax=Nakamurella lactea TaxID=459515 RepID=UPI0003FA75AB|nr:helix-turn-helix domain-containing protein [Nakamurella lactea]